MIKSIEGIAKRFFKENKLIAFTSILGVMISISLIITMVVFVSNAKQSLVKEVEKMYGMMDLAVGYNPDQELFIDTSLSKTLSDQDGITQASHVLLAHYVVDDVAEAYYTVGVENDSLAKSRYKFTEDIEQNEVSLNNGLAKLFGVKQGDTLSIESIHFTVKEILPDFEAAGHVADTLLLNYTQVRQLETAYTKLDKRADFMMFEVDASTNIYQVAQTFQEIDSSFRVDIAAEDDFMKNNLDLLNRFMIGLSILVILITSLLLISNFELFLYKYKYELAILRSMGASKWQVFKLIFIQSAFMNLLGAISAILFTAFTYRYLQFGLEKVFSLSIEVMNFNVLPALFVTIISMIVIQVFMLIPAYRSSQLLPMTIMQENEAIDFTHIRLRKQIGFTAFGISALFIVGGVYSENFPLNILIGSIGILLSSAFLIPLYLGTWMRKTLPIVKGVFGNISYVSLKNTIPQVRKNTFVVLIISAMMIIVVFGSTFIQTIQNSDKSFIKEQYETEIMIKNRLASNGEINPIEFKETIQQLHPGTAVSTQSEGEMVELRLNNEVILTNFTFADVREMQNQGLLKGEIDHHDGLIVSEAFAEEYDIHIGDRLDLLLQFDYDLQVFKQNTTMTVTGIVDKFPFSSWYRDFMIDWEATHVDTSYKTFQLAFVGGQSPQLTLNELEGLTSLYPQIQIDSLTQSLKQSEEMSAQRWGIFIVVLVVILLSVLFGVINTLINNINSKRKEFAILRVIHMKPKEIIQVIMTQVTTYISLGIVIGILLGMVFTYLISLVDDIKVYFNFTLIASLSLIVFCIAYLILVPFANHLGKSRIAAEITRNHH